MGGFVVSAAFVVAFVVWFWFWFVLSCPVNVLFCFGFGGVFPKGPEFSIGLRILTAKQASWETSIWQEVIATHSSACYEMSNNPHPLFSLRLTPTSSPEAPVGATVPLLHLRGRGCRGQWLGSKLEKLTWDERWGEVGELMEKGGLCTIFLEVETFYNNIYGCELRSHFGPSLFGSWRWHTFPRLETDCEIALAPGGKIRTELAVSWRIKKASLPSPPPKKWRYALVVLDPLATGCSLPWRSDQVPSEEMLTSTLEG